MCMCACIVYCSLINTQHVHQNACFCVHVRWCGVSWTAQWHVWGQVWVNRPAARHCTELKWRNALPAVVRVDTYTTLAFVVIYQNIRFMQIKYRSCTVIFTRGRVRYETGNTATLYKYFIDEACEPSRGTEKKNISKLSHYSVYMSIGGDRFSNHSMGLVKVLGWFTIKH